MIRSLGENIYAGRIDIDEAEVHQSNVLKHFVEFNSKSRTKNNRR